MTRRLWIFTILAALSVALVFAASASAILDVKSEADHLPRFSLEQPEPQPAAQVITDTDDYCHDNPCYYYLAR